MKKLSKSLFTFLLVAVLAMSFTACGKNQGTSEQTTENAASPAGTNSIAQNDANSSEPNGTASTAQNDTSTAEPNGTAPTAQAQTLQNNIITKTGLWENATYLEDTEFGQGSRKLIVEVKADNQTVKFTVHTDEQTVGAALLANNLIDGEAGAYGLYVKVVNGITADYDIDQSYWAFYIDGEYAMSGVDTTDISEGSVYCLERTK